MLHLGDALGFSDDKIGNAQQVSLDDSVRILLDLNDPDRLSFTSKQLALTIKHLAHELYRFRSVLPGYPRDDTIVTVFPQSCDSLFAILSVAALSWAAAPLSPEDKAEGYKHSFRVLKPTLVFAHQSCREAIEAANDDGLAVLTFDWRFSDDSAPKPSCKFLNREPAVITEGSDTNALPLLCPHETDVCLRYRKPGTDLIIPLTQRNVVVSFANIQRCYGFQGILDVIDVADERIDAALCVAPIHQVHGLVATCLSMLSMQAGVVIAQFDPASFWHDILKYNITWTSLIPHMVFELLATDPSTWPNSKLSHLVRFIRVTSLHLDAKTSADLEQLTGGIPVLSAYSAGIATHQITSNGYPSFDHRLPGSVGLPTGCEVCILNDELECVPRETEGNIWIRGHTVIDAYEGARQVVNEVDAQDYAFHNSIEWSLARPPSFLSSSLDLGSGRRRVFSSKQPSPSTAPSDTSSPVLLPAPAENPEIAPPTTNDLRLAEGNSPDSEISIHTDSPVSPAGPTVPQDVCNAPSLFKTLEKEKVSNMIRCLDVMDDAMGHSPPSPMEGSAKPPASPMVTEGDVNDQEKELRYTARDATSTCTNEGPEPIDMFEKPRGLQLRGKKINRFASGLSAYVSDFPMRDDPMLSPLPLIIRWVKTHDVGKMDADGRLYIAQRVTKIIRIGTHAVSTDKIEKRLRSHPMIEDALAIGIPHDLTGQKIVAVIKPKNKQQVSIAELLHEMSSKHPAYEVPSEILIIPHLPPPDDGVSRQKLSQKIYHLYVMTN